MKFNLLLMALLLFSCSKSSQIPELQQPQFSVSNEDADALNCEARNFTINFEFESYSIDEDEPHPWNSTISGWIPDETDPTFYIISYDWQFCNSLQLMLEDYTFTVEEINNPNGYWYEVTVSETEFAAILNGQTVSGKLERQINDCSTRSFYFDLNSEVYTFGGPFKEFDEHFSASANFQPAEILIYANNVALCDYLDLELENYSYTLESSPVPHYRVLLSETDLVPLVNGVGVGGRFQYKKKFETKPNEPVFD